MIHAIYLTIIGVLLGCGALLALNRQMWKTTADTLAKDITTMRESHSRLALSLASARKSLTPKAEVVDHLPKRLTGPQLRVLNDRLNATIPERTNSEILKEQANG